MYEHRERKHFSARTVKVQNAEEKESQKTTSKWKTFAYRK